MTLEGQIHVRTLCPNWQKEKAANPKKRHSSMTCPLECGHEDAEYWIYQWIPFAEMRKYVECDTLKCELCPRIARPGKTLCDACGDLEAERVPKKRKPRTAKAEVLEGQTAMCSICGEPAEGPAGTVCAACGDLAARGEALGAMGLSDLL